MTTNTAQDARAFMIAKGILPEDDDLVVRARREIEREECIHPGVFAQGPVPGTEHCGTCQRDISRHLL